MSCHSTQRSTSFTALDRHCRIMKKTIFQIIVINRHMTQKNLEEFLSETVR